VSRQWTIGHREALRAPVTLCCLLSLFFCLLFVGDELCFAFFMDWPALGVDQLGVLCCLWMAMNYEGWWMASTRKSFQLSVVKSLLAKFLSF
jgi:hypothetical protein